MGFFDKIDNVSDSNIIKKVLHWRSSKMFVTRTSARSNYVEHTRRLSKLVHSTLICFATSDSNSPGFNLCNS